MKEGWWIGNRKKVAFALVVAAIMVASAVVAFVPGFVTRTGANPASTSAAPQSAAAPVANLANGPLSQVAPASTYSPSGPTSLPPSIASSYSITPDNSAYSSTATLTIQVGLTAASSMSSYESAVSNPGSAAYRQYLTQAGIGSKFGVAPSVYSQITTYFSTFGLNVVTHPDYLTIGLTGTPGQFQKAFHTNVQAFALNWANANVYNPVFDQITGTQTFTVGGQTMIEPVWTSEPQVFYANTGGLNLPAGIAKYVSSVVGFGSQLVQPQLTTLYSNYPGTYNSATDAVNTTGGEWNYLGGPDHDHHGAPPDPFSLASNCAANYSWYNYFGENVQLLFPSSMPTLNGACTLFTGADTILSEPDYGQGVTIAVVEVGAVDPAQLAQFSHLTWPTGKYPNGLTTDLLSRLTFIDLGASNLGQAINQGLNYGWETETALDIEYAASMAPEAHIDLVSVPNAFFSSFDEAYSFIGAHLVGQQSCNIPSSDPVFGPVFVYGPTSDVNGGSACQVSITSNSYGEGETYNTFFGSPMYIQFASVLLEELAIEGVTSFFANGDSGGTYIVVEDFMSADSQGVISVGGGQKTADDNGVAFPNTGKYTFLESGNETYYGSTYEYGNYVTLAPVTSEQSFTYWAYPSAEGTIGGGTGGGFGQSIRTAQPWWEAGNDTYTDGARIDPIISNAAAFNMTIYYEECFGDYPYYFFCNGPWNYVYGGTSFASPISAGGWALIEEQLDQRYGPGAQYTGDIGPILFEAHNAWLAGAPGTVNPFVPMTNIGIDQGATGGDYAPFNAYTWYYENLSIQVPDGVDHPWWAQTLFNPAIPPGWTDAKFLGGASAWNGLQGLGEPNWDLLDQMIVGATATSHAFDNDPFYVQVVTPTGLQDISELACGTQYTFEIVSSVALGNAPINVIAYSGTPDDGTAYGGGTTTVITVTGAPWTFTYTPLCPLQPITGPTSLNNSGWYYGYFLAIQEGSNPYGGNDWTFAQFGDQAPAVGTLNLCMSDVEDICQSSVAEETMFLTYDGEGFYNLQGQANALVTLTEPDGLVTTVESASVVQVSVVTDYGSQDPTLSPATYAPGVEIGNYLTDAKGTADIWDNAFIAETICQVPATGLDNEYGSSTDGSQPVIPPACLQTQVYTITAYFDGLVSNTVTVYVEPQMGSFYPQLQLVSGHIVGFVQFAQMTNVQYVNISVGGGPGQFDNVSFLPDCAYPGIVSYFGSDGLTEFPENPGNYCYSSGAGVPPTGPTPQSVCQMGDPAAFYAENDWLCGSGVKEGVVEVNLAIPGVTDGSDPAATVSMLAVGWNNLGFSECFEGFCYQFAGPQYGIYWQDPMVFLPASVSLAATGTVTGTDLVSWSGSTFPSATGTLSLVWGGGSMTLETVSLGTGHATSGTYTLDTTKLADGSYSVVFTENAPGATPSVQKASFYAANTAEALGATVASLQSELSTATATISTLNAELSADAQQIANLETLVSSLQSGWSAANASVASLNAQLATAEATIGSLQSQVSSLQTETASLSSQLASEQSNAAALAAQVAQLQAQLNAQSTQSSSDQSQIQALEAQLASVQAQLQTAQATIATDQAALANANSQISADQAQIATLNGQVQTLQKELNDKKNYIAPAWYDTWLGGGLILLFAGLGAVIGIGGTWAVMRRRRSTTTVPDRSGSPSSGPARVAPLGMPAP